jgi:hypothetical protein
VLASEDEVDANESLLNSLSASLGQVITLHNNPNIDLIPVFEVGSGVATPTSVTFRALLNNSSNASLNTNPLRSVAQPSSGTPAVYDSGSDDEFVLK